MDLNIWVIIGAGTAYTILGALWYSPVLFGNIWLKITKRNTTEMEAPKFQLVFV